MPRLVRPSAETMPRRHRLIELERIADRQHPLGDLQLGRIAHGIVGRLRALIFSSARSIVGIDADNLRAHLAFVAERDR
jgi:hypothetical protein